MPRTNLLQNATAKPSGPKPGEGGWEIPIPLDDVGSSLAPFPIQVFPRALQDLCLSSAASVGCPVDYSASHALGVAAGVIGGTYDLQVKRGFFAPSMLWVCVVAPPGSGKSPAVAPILAPVYAEQSRRRNSSDPKPTYVSDVTVEKLAQFLCDNPRGLTMVWDEMSGWLTSFNQYKTGGKGNDRAHYLSVWDGRPLKVDRKGPDSPPVFAQRPRLSVVGGIQPEVLDELRTGPADGLFDRFLFSYPADPGLAVETFAEVDEDAATEWEKALRNLWGRKMHTFHEGADERPNVILLTDEGRPVWQGWTQELSRRVAAPDSPPYLRAVAAKVQGYAARIALVIHLLREAYGETPGLGVGAEDMMRAVALAGYFLEHADRVRRAAGRDMRLTRARLIHRWMVGADRPTFTRSAAWASLRNNSAFGSPEELDKPLELLITHRCLRWQRDEGGTGRPAAGGGRYELNPALLRESGVGDQTL